MDTVLKFLDGINLDFEDAVAVNSPEQRGLTDLVKETVEAFHKYNPGSQVSVISYMKKPIFSFY